MLTGHGTVDMCRRAFKSGAAEFLEKPVNDEHLLEALQKRRAPARQVTRTQQNRPAGTRTVCATVRTRTRSVGPDRQGQEIQGRYPGQSGAPVQGDQAPVWLCEGALPRIDEEHGAARHAVCPVQFMDDARKFDGSAGMDAPENRANALRRAKKAPVGGKNEGISGNFAI